MKLAAGLGLLLCVTAGAQDRPLTEFVFVGPGEQTLGTSPSTKITAYGLGGGLEKILIPGPYGAVGLNGSMEGVVFAIGSGSNSIGIFTVGGDYHLPRIPALENFDFFFGGGYAVMFRTFGASGLDYGGGFNYWFPSRRWALRVEFREDQARPAIQPYFQNTRTGPYTHIWEIRLGFTHGGRPLD